MINKQQELTKTYTYKKWDIVIEDNYYQGKGYYCFVIPKGDQLGELDRVWHDVLPKAMGLDKIRSHIKHNIIDKFSIDYKVTYSITYLSINLDKDTIQEEINHARINNAQERRLYILRIIEQQLQEQLFEISEHIRNGGSATDYFDINIKPTPNYKV